MKIRHLRAAHTRNLYCPSNPPEANAKLFVSLSFLWPRFYVDIGRAYNVFIASLMFCPFFCLSICVLWLFSGRVYYCQENITSFCYYECVFLKQYFLLLMIQQTYSFCVVVMWCDVMWWSTAFSSKCRFVFIISVFCISMLSVVSYIAY